MLYWNLPSNPVDFEQREGRVTRFAGHAVRTNPWRVAFDSAVERGTWLGEFAP